MKRLLIVMFCVLLLFCISACGTESESDAKDTIEKEAETTGDAEENADLSENIENTAYLSEDTEDMETRKNPDELEYIACTVDELVTEMYGDIEAVAAKYNGKYMEITGTLDRAEIDEGAGSAVVYMKTTVEPPYENSMAMVTADYYLWENEWMTMEECKEMAKTLAEGDEVVLRGYVDDYSLYKDGIGNTEGVRWCHLTLIGIRKK